MGSANRSDVDIGLDSVRVESKFLQKCHAVLNFRYQHEKLISNFQIDFAHRVSHALLRSRLVGFSLPKGNVKAER